MLAFVFVFVLAFVFVFDFVLFLYLFFVLGLFLFCSCLILLSSCLSSIMLAYAHPTICLTAHTASEELPHALVFAARAAKYVVKCWGLLQLETKLGIDVGGIDAVDLQA